MSATPTWDMTAYPHFSTARSIVCLVHPRQSRPLVNHGQKSLVRQEEQFAVHHRFFVLCTLFFLRVISLATEPLVLSLSTVFLDICFSMTLTCQLTQEEALRAWYTLAHPGHLSIVDKKSLVRLFVTVVLCFDFDMTAYPRRALRAWYTLVNLAHLSIMDRSHLCVK